MTIKVQDVTCRLFIGFGGSGGKTLVQLAQMFAHDREWARRSESEAYFLLIDTDVGDVEKHESAIRRALTDVGAHAWVRSIGLAEGIHDFARAVDQKIRLPQDQMRRQEYLSRFHDTWWFKREGDARPWNGCKLPQPPTAGAGQCSAIAYYLSWIAMSGANSALGECLDSLCSQMSERVTQQHGTTKYSVDMYVIAGLAGGTGRGSWAPTSMKIAELLNSRGKIVRPTGIFFDWSCFKDVANGTKGQRAKMMVNSLTGMSMITGWIQNDALFGDRVHLTWPAFMDPLNEQRDVFSMRRLVDPGCEGTQMGCTPARQAWIVFGESAAGQLADKEHYAIAAAALYGRNVKSEVNSTLSNTVQSLGSIGASIYRVDVHHIQDYLRQELLKSVVDDFLTQQADAKIQSIVRAIARPMLTLPQAAPAEQFAARLDDKVVGEMKSRLASLFCAPEGGQAQVNEKDVSALEASIKEILTFSERQGIEKQLTECVRATISTGMQSNKDGGQKSDEGKTESGYELILSYVKHVLKCGFPAGHPSAEYNSHCTSVATALAVVRKLKSELKEIPNGLRTGAPDGNVSVSPAEIAAAISKKRDGFLWWKRKLTIKECNDAQKLVENALKKNVRLKAFDKLNEWLERKIVPALDRWEDNLQTAHTAAAKFKYRIKSSTDQSTAEDQLFLVGKDFARFKNRQETATGVTATHILQPVLELEGQNQKQDWLKKLQDSLANERFEKSLKTAQSAVFEGAYSDAAATGTSSKRTIELERSIETHWNRLRDDIAVPLEFMRAQFSLIKVLGDQYKEWVYQLDEARGDEKVSENLLASFKEQLGFTPEKDDFGYKQISGLEVLEHVAMRVGQRCCAQYINSRSWKETPDTLVFLPTDIELAKSEQGVKEFVTKLNHNAESSGSPVKFHGELATDQEKVDARGNPFQVIAVTFEGFQANGEAAVSYDVAGNNGGIAPPDLDHITSLNYWRDNGEREAQLLLDASESESGDSWFHPPLESTIGIGYEIPAFVRNDTLRKCRWRPWDADKDRRREASRRAREYLVEDAIIYALLSPELAFPDKVSVCGEERHHDIVMAGVKQMDGVEIRWQLPSLAWAVSKSAKGHVDGVRFLFTRKAFRDNNGQWEMSGHDVNPAVSFDSILDMLLHLRSGDGARAVKAIHSEAAHYFGEVLDLERRAIELEDVVELFREVRRRLENELLMHMSGLPGYKTKLAPRVSRLLDRVAYLENMSPDALHKHFRGA